MKRREHKLRADWPQGACCLSCWWPCVVVRMGENGNNVSAVKNDELDDDELDNNEVEDEDSDEDDKVRTVRLQESVSEEGKHPLLLAM